MSEETKNKTGVEMYEHPEYIHQKEFYEEMEHFLRPDKYVLRSTKYLWPHACEEVDRQVDDRDKKLAEYDRSLRETRTRYVNYLKMVASRIVSLVVKGGIDFKEDIKALGEDIAGNVDGENTNLDSYFAKLFLDDIAFGIAYNLINTKTNLAIDSLADEQGNKEARPYFVHLHPLDVKDWGLENSGDYKQFRYEYECTEERVSLSSQPFITRYCEVWEYKPVINDSGKKLIVTASKFASADKEHRIINYYLPVKERNEHKYWIAKGEPVVINGLDRLPVKCVKSEPWLKDVLPIVQKIYNKESECDNIIYSNGYDKTFLFAELEGSSNPDGKVLSDSEKKIKIAHNSITLAPVNSSVVKLEPTDPIATFKSIEQDKISLMQIAFNMLRVSPPDAKVAEAADSRKEIKEDLLTRIKEKREQYISFMRKSIELMMKYKKVDSDYQSKAAFSTNIEQSDIDEVIADIRLISDRISRYPSWDKAVDVRLVQAGNYSNEEEILEEIKTTDLEQLKKEEEEQIKGAFGKMVNAKPKGNSANKK